MLQIFFKTMEDKIYELLETLVPTNIELAWQLDTSQNLGIKKDVLLVYEDVKKTMGYKGNLNTFIQYLYEECCYIGEVMSLKEIIKNYIENV